MVCLKCDHRRLKKSNPSDISAQPEYRKGDSTNLRGLNSKSDENRDRRSHYSEGADVWKFVEEDCVDAEEPNLDNGVSGFFDFPIAGGKSDFSQNPAKRELWKLKVSEGNKDVSRAGEDKEDDDFRSRNRGKRLDLLESTDDEEISEWFDHTHR